MNAMLYQNLTKKLTESLKNIHSTPSNNIAKLEERKKAKLSNCSVWFVMPSKANNLMALLMIQRLIDVSR